jgi:hypothetical protein
VIEIPFEAFPKIPRLSRECIITEKIDGTNSQVFISDDGEMQCGSRNRWIAPGKATDNFGFAGWAEANKQELLKLGPGRHFGEWWGAGIGRRYGRIDKVWSLFNTTRWSGEDRPSCCSVVPELYRGEFLTEVVSAILGQLARGGSCAEPGFMDPEGIVIFHEASGQLFKKTLIGDEHRKGLLA